MAEPIQLFDEAVSAELPRISTIEYDSRKICKHFAGKVRQRIEDALSTSPAAVDVEQLLRDTVPGGSSCDPQQIADAIRAWFVDRSSPAAREGVQQDTKPDAWMVKWYGSDGYEFVNASASKLVAQQHALRVGGAVIDLYATPPLPQAPVPTSCMRKCRCCHRIKSTGCIGCHPDLSAQGSAAKHTKASPMRWPINGESCDDHRST